MSARTTHTALFATTRARALTEARGARGAHAAETKYSESDSDKNIVVALWHESKPMSTTCACSPEQGLPTKPTAAAQRRVLAEKSSAA